MTPLLKDSRLSCRRAVATTAWLAATGLFALLTPTFASAQTNLLTNNPSFEGAGTAGHSNGSGTIPGWDWQQWDYNWNSVNVADGDATNGTRRFYLNNGGLLGTTSSARATVIPNRQYELNFDAKKTRDDKPSTWRGIFAFVQFFDSSGTMIKEVRGGEFLYSGTTGWETVKMRATAPANAAKAGVYIYHDRGSYGDDQDMRDFTVDNFRLYEVAEAKDIAQLRGAPRIVDKGKTVSVKVRYAAKAARTIAVRLLNGTTVLQEATTTVGIGRGLVTLNLTVPTTLGNSTAYSWETRSYPSGGSWSSPSASSTASGVICDDAVSGSGSVNADNANIVYEGRVNRTTPSATVLYWPASQIRTRFNGTSIALRGSSNSGYSVNMVAIIDGDTTNMRKFTVSGSNQTVSIATGLTNTTHSICLYKNTDNTGWLTFQGFNLDSGKGLLRPAPSAAKRIEFYGDSITEGGTPDAKSASADRNNDGDWDNNSARTYAAVSTRELGMDARMIAKGGMALVHNAGFQSYCLRDIWNKFNFDGYTPSNATINDFAAWKPDAVVIAIGHNDQFGSGSSQTQFAIDYQAQITDLHNKYPNVPIFCTNTTMSDDNPQWEKAIVPVLASDPLVHFRLFTNQGHGGHPRADDHAAMALGNNKWLGIADWVEETLIGMASDGGDGKSSSGAVGSGTPGPNLVNNPDFESQQYYSDSITDWSEWSNGNYDAGYVENYGGAYSGSYHATHWRSTDYQNYLFQTKTGLANGLYTLRAWTKRGGNQKACYLEAKDFGGTARTATLPVSDTWQLVEIKDINVTNGSCTIGFWSDAYGGNWAHFDKVEFFKQP